MPPMPAITVPQMPAMPSPRSVLGRIPLSIPIALGITGVSTLAMYLLSRMRAASALAEANVVANPSSGSDPGTLQRVKAAMPAYAHYIADLAFELGPKYGMDPVLILAMSYHESRWGEALKPTRGPTGYGDWVPRKGSKYVPLAQLKAIAARLGVPLKETARGVIPVGKGWGWGLFQIDMASHEKFIASGKWSDPRASMEYAITNVFLSNQKDIKKAFPNLSPADLWYATIVSYNAGAGGAIRGLKQKNGNAKLIDQAPGAVTFNPGYAANILRTAAKLREGKKP